MMLVVLKLWISVVVGKYKYDSIPTCIYVLGAAKFNFIYFFRF